MKRALIVTLMVIIAGCSTQILTKSDNYCDHLNDTLNLKWNLNSKRIYVSGKFISDFDEHFSKCFINKDTNFLIKNLGRNYSESLPLAKKEIVDSLFLIKAFEYPVFLLNDSSNNRFGFLFFLNKNGMVRYYRRIQILESVSH